MDVLWINFTKNKNVNSGDSGYGSAPEGSMSEERAKKAAVWVEKEVFKLLGEIETIGRTSGNEVQVTFGELFVHYQDVSDTLVRFSSSFYFLVLKD